MPKVIKFLEYVVTDVTDENGAGYEAISLSEAKIACEIQELETLQLIDNEFLRSVPYNGTTVEERIKTLEKKLKHIKYK